jgi:alpha,alpha-trehalase
VTAWSLVYEGYDPAEEGLREALCTLGNGYFATRGALPETTADGVHYPGTYVAGCFNRLVTEVAGRRVVNESLVNVPNWLLLTIRTGSGQQLDVRTSTVLAHRIELDLRRGVLIRRTRFADTDGRITSVTQRRVVSMADPHVAALETTVLAENWSGSATVTSVLDGNVANTGVERYRELDSVHLRTLGAQGDDDVLVLHVETNQSRVEIALAARTDVTDGAERVTGRRFVAEPGAPAHEIDLALTEGTPVTIDKVVALATSRDRAISEPVLAARTLLGRIGSFDEVLVRHALAWAHLWRRFPLRADGDGRVQMIVNLHVFHILQTISPHSADLDVGVPARGLHGEAYRGHIFWDELFVFPLLNHRLPELGRELLLYRYRRLPEARAAARAEGLDGAMFPWQSGSDGSEETQTMHLNPASGRWLPDRSHRQRHIGSAIALNVWKYFQATGDIEFMSFYGAEMLLEIARFWSSLASYDHAKDRYVINGVMGPDEYHDGYPDRDEPGLSNNAYTNVLAAWVMCRAIEVLEVLPERRRVELVETLGIGADERSRWDDLSRRMYVPFHGDGVISQFDGYEQLEEFDWEGYRARYGNIERLDRVLENEGDTPNRYQVAKQADVLMLFYLLTADELARLFERLGYAYDEHLIPKNIAYYLERTAHGSTLSGVVHAWVLARSDRERSWRLFCRALESDVGDIQGGTTAEGVHLGAMAGSLDLLQRCYTGLDSDGDELCFSPLLPPEIPQLELELRHRGATVGVLLTHDQLRVATLPDSARPVTVRMKGEVATIAPGESTTIALTDGSTLVGRDEQDR